MRPIQRPMPIWRSLLLAGFSVIAVAGVISGSQSSRALAGSASGAAGAPSLELAGSPSTADQLALVEHLRLKGAVFYGAWWCPHCLHQKEMFGVEAALRLPYVECDKDDAGRQRCAAVSIRAFPTWDLNGQRREGVLTIEELKLWSGFQAPAAP